MIISMVAAVADNLAIGAGGNLLWRLPTDMAKFKEITYGHHVLMGRKTYESIPPKFRPLPGRVNIVISRNADFAPEGCKVVRNTDEAIAFAKSCGEKELMVIGGAEIYKQLLPRTFRIYLTKVHASFADADAFFPELNVEDWEVVEAEDWHKDDKNSIDCTYRILERVSR